MTSTESARVSTVTCATPSHLEGVPYERREEVFTRYDDYKGDARAWDDLGDGERATWAEWLDRMHEQDRRLVEAHLTEAEESIYDESFGYVDWEDLPSAVEKALDSILDNRS